ncbi:MAG: hypothetical protein V2A53_02070 [bacterium]
MNTVTIESDKPMAIISIEEYEGMKETIELLAQNPNLGFELKEERRRMEEGEHISYEEFKNE